MLLPPLNEDGFLPPGIYLASLDEVVTRFGVGNPTREGLARLLSEIIVAARNYLTIKRVLVWGSWTSAKPEPRDLDFSIVVGRGHLEVAVQPQHRRFFAPYEAKVYYGADKTHLIVYDHVLDEYVEFLHFFGQTREGTPRGIVELHVHGEYRFSEVQEAING